MVVWLSHTTIHVFASHLCKRSFDQGEQIPIVIITARDIGYGRSPLEKKVLAKMRSRIVLF
ncbi:hypothetical protein H6G00_05755 [Leptolyngbya sp. FACHB-541]|uniref:hypothetical protein n=1 Tax=Leptolyngbya sp. FACHB-541 TaxID=2692810 RepID=UPI00168248A2|nr:hypothetical protein [Leptolyngbya sp. FACHB-541]MBD1996122.1 hypothetical protein [Leptolyngbya sp. FACHB-541]